MENDDNKASVGTGTPEFTFVGRPDLEGQTPGDAVVSVDPEDKKPEEPTKPEAPEAKKPAGVLQAKVAGIKAVTETTVDEWTNYAVGIVNPETGKYEEYLVPRNAVKLLSALQNTVANKGEAYAEAQVTVSKVIPQPTQDGSPVAVRLQLIDAKLSTAIEQVRDIMVASPEAAYRAMRVNSEPVFEASDCVFMDIVMFFRSKGATGETLRTPHFEMCHDDALKYYNALCAHAEMFKISMKREGIDLDAKQIITSSGGFNARKTR